MTDPAKRIVAAGTVTVRLTGELPEILLVHRPRYDDWSLPKGKLDPQEYLAACAVRETDEESAVRTRLGLPVGEITYPISSGTKSVSYWLGHPVTNQAHRPNNEVDRVEWFSVTAALRQTSYADEREVIRRAVNLPSTTALVILRHAKAMSRAEWTGTRDQDRPLDPRGRTQAKALVSLLDAYGVQRVVTSAATRCTKTVQPFVAAADIEAESRGSLTQEAGTADPAKVTKLLGRLAAETAASGTPTVVCGHRPVMPAMLAGLGIDPHALSPAAALVAHLDASATVVALELHNPVS